MTKSLHRHCTFRTVLGRKQRRSGFSAEMEGCICPPQFQAVVIFRQGGVNHWMICLTVSVVIFRQGGVNHWMICLTVSVVIFRQGGVNHWMICLTVYK